MSDRSGPGVDGHAEALLAHLDAAYNLARWLLGNAAAAEQVVGEVYQFAFQHRGEFRPDTPRAQVLATVHRASYRRLEQPRAKEMAHGRAREASSAGEEWRIERALSDLPIRFREVLVLRELEGLSYKEIGDVMGEPTSTVVSTLSRARALLRHAADALCETCLSVS